MTEISSQTALAAENPQIWDPLVRAFHWLLVLCVFGAWGLGKFGPVNMTVHFWLGYGVAGLLAFRLLWGLIGPANVRFVNFIKGPVTVARYVATLPLRKPSAHGGHNPLGGWSVLALLLALAGQVVSGLFLGTDDYVNMGPLSGHVSEATNKLALIWHYRIAPIILLLVGIHLAAIAFYRFWKREDLVTPMITGRAKG